MSVSMFKGDSSTHDHSGTGRGLGWWSGNWPLIICLEKRRRGVLTLQELGEEGREEGPELMHYCGGCFACERGT